jgi:NCS1 family nucleobase:cation symporter-1
VVLLVSYWIPGFVAVIIVDWLIRTRGRTSIDPATELTARTDAAAAMIAFLLAYVVALPFMYTTLIQGPIAKAWFGADIAYFVNLGVAAALYGGFRIVRGQSR